ncbi:MAG: hypothetical protein AAF413_02530 [Patescibacteria group bacterium]
MSTLQWNDYVEGERFGSKADFDKFIKKSKRHTLIFANDSISLYTLKLYPGSPKLVIVGELDSLKTAPPTNDLLFLRVKKDRIRSPHLTKVTDTYSLTYLNSPKQNVALRDVENLDGLLQNYLSTHQHYRNIDKELLADELGNMDLKILEGDGFTIWLEDLGDRYETSYYRVGDNPEAQGRLLNQLKSLGSFEMEIDLHIPSNQFIYYNLKDFCTYECSLYRLDLARDTDA